MRIVGLLFLVGFGLVWFVVGLAGLDLSGAALLTVALGYAGSAAVVAGLVYRFVKVSAIPQQPETDWQGRFNRVGIIQGLAIGLAVALLILGNQPGLIPPVVCLIVGLHFFPLANIFGVSLYRITAAALCIVAVAGLIVAWTEGRESSQAVVGVGAAVALWLTAVALSPGYHPAQASETSHIEQESPDVS